MINIWYTTVKRNIFWLCWILLLTNRLEKFSIFEFFFFKFYFQYFWCLMFVTWELWINCQTQIELRIFEFFDVSQKNFFWTFLVPYLGLHTVWPSADYAIGIPCIPHKTSKKWQNIPTMKFHYSSDDFILSDFYLAKSVPPRACLYLRLHWYSRILAPQNSLIDSSSYE